MVRLSGRARCSVCGKVMPRDAELCPACGAQVVRAQPTYGCPGCGARVATSRVGCPICGQPRHKRDWSRVYRFVRSVTVLAVLIAVGLWAWERLGTNQSQVVMGPTATATATNSPFPTWTPVSTPTRSATPTFTLLASRTPTLAPSATPTAVPSLASSATPVNEKYVVVAGDSLIGIARKLGMEVEQLLVLNGLGANAILQVDQELLVMASGSAQPQPVAETPLVSDSATIEPTATGTVEPSATPSATPGLLVHVVAPGDILGSLAVAYDVDSEAIAQANNIALTAILHVGQELLIPGTTPTPSITPSATITPTATDAATPLPTIPPRPTQMAFPYRSPMALAPTNGSFHRGADADIVLNWTSVGILDVDEWYDVNLVSPCSGEPSHILTKATSWRLPAEAFCLEAESDAYAWSVRIVRRSDPQHPSLALSLPSKPLHFWWQPPTVR